MIGFDSHVVHRGSFVQQDKMPRKQKKYHVIYKTTCKVNNKYYVGMHSTNNLDDGYLGSGKYLWNSIKKHGKENFEFEILEFFDNRKDLRKREETLVNEDLLQDPLCMNLKTGGDGGFVNEAHQMKCSLAGACAPGRTDKSTKTLRTNLLDDDFRTKYCNKIKAARKDQPGNCAMTGKTHSDDTKQKMSLSGQGNKNSQYGTCWINKSGINKKIKKEELPSFIDNGWVKGRKMGP